MQYYRCKCGASYAYSSMGMNACESCRLCGSDLAAGPSAHAEPVPHDFSLVEQVETDNGPQPLTRCRYCAKTRAAVARADADFELAQAQRKPVGG